MNDYEELSDSDKLAEAEKLIEGGKLEEAQRLIDSVKPKLGRRYFVQSKLFKAKSWYSEERKQLKKAIAAEPENEEYKRALDDLEAFRKSDEYKKMKMMQMGNDGFAECCLITSFECCGTGFCDAICNGCS